MKPGFVVEISGEVPSKKNSRRIFMAGGRTVSVPSGRHAKWYRSALAEITSAKVGCLFPIKGRLRVDCTFYHGDRRRRDHNNQMASILDLLVDAGIIADDSWDIVAEEFCKGRLRKGLGGARIEIGLLKPEVNDETNSEFAVGGNSPICKQS